MEKAYEEYFNSLAEGEKALSFPSSSRQFLECGVSQRLEGGFLRLRAKA
ncbi:hypothetical protein RMS96_000008 [Enterobacter kobei]|nr:hypothetical protein [Enterobacter kobei]